MLTFNNKKAYNWMDNYIRNTYKEIKVEGGNCRYNFRCHLNAVHDAIKADEKEIAMIMCVSSRATFIHFVNLNENKYTDNTLGIWIDGYECYLVRHIQEKDFRDINSIFTDFKKHIEGKLPTWLSLTSKLDL